MPKEIVFSAESQAELAEYEDSPLEATDLRGPTVCFLVSQGTELAWLGGGAEFPIRPGYGAVFRVREIGSDVAGVEPGE